MLTNLFRPFGTTLTLLGLAAALFSGGAPAAAQSPGVAKALDAAVTIELKDAAGRALRRVNGTLVPQGVIVQTSALLGATQADIRSRGGDAWNVTQVTATNGSVGLALLPLPSASPHALAFPPSGAYMPGMRVFVLQGPGAGADSVSATIYEHFALRGQADLSPVTPGVTGAAPVVDPSGRFLGVACDLTEGAVKFGFIVPMASVRVVAMQGGTPAPMTSFNGTGGPPFEDRTTVAGLLFRGAVLTRTQAPEDARIFLSEALKKDPLNAEAYFWSGQAYFAQEQFQRAAEEFQQAGAKEPGYHLAWHMAGAALNQAADYAGAEQMYQKALQAKPNAADTYCNLGGAYYNMQRTEDAIAALRRSIQIDPRYARGLAYTNLAVVLNGVGRTAEAEQVYEDLRKVNEEWAARLRAVLDGQPR